MGLGEARGAPPLHEGGGLSCAASRDVGHASPHVLAASCQDVICGSSLYLSLCDWSRHSDLKLKFSNSKDSEL